MSDNIFKASITPTDLRDAEFAVEDLYQAFKDRLNREYVVREIPKIVSILQLQQQIFAIEEGGGLYILKARFDLPLSRWELVPVTLSAQNDQ